MQIYLGKFKVIRVEPTFITLLFGRHEGNDIHIHIPTKLFTHDVRVNDTLPLLTEIPNGKLSKPSIK